MTLASTTPKEIKNGNDVTTSFSFGFVINQSSDLVVTHTDADGVETVLTEGAGTTNYSVTVSSYPGTGSITYPATLGTELATGETLTLARVVELDQDTDLQNQGAYSPSQVEAAFDYSRMIDLQQQEQIDRAIKAPISDDSGADYTIPTASAGKIIGVWNSAGTAIESGPTAGDISSAQSNAAIAAAAAATASAAAATATAAAAVLENAGNMVDEVFTAGVDFTAGSSTEITLATDAGNETNVWVFFDAALQGSDTYSYDDGTQVLTFSSAIPGGVSKVYVKVGTTLPVNTISDNAVTTSKINDSAVTNAKLADMAQSTIKGRASGAGTGVVTDLTATQVNTILGTLPSIDEDNMASDSASYVPTQQSVKAYVDSAVSGGYLADGGVIHVQYQTASSTIGAVTADAWTTRGLNTVVLNDISGASLSSNQVTLPAGTYRFKGGACFRNTDEVAVRLYDATNTSALVQGFTVYASVDSYDPVEVCGEFTLAGAAAVELQYYAQVTSGAADQGFGFSSVVTNCFAELFIEKVG